MAIELKHCQYEQCNKEMYGSKNRRFCSDKCRKAHNRKTKKKEVIDED